MVDAGKGSRAAKLISAVIRRDEILADRWFQQEAWGEKNGVKLVLRFEARSVRLIALVTAS